VVEQVAEILSRPPLRGAEVALNYDSTGVGSAVSDILIDAYDAGKLPCFPQGVTLTGAEPALEIPIVRAGIRRVPKQDVLAPLEIALAEGRLQFASGLALAGPLKEELLNFKASHTSSGHAKFEAGGSGHDDLVIALALALYTGGGTQSQGESNFAASLWACTGCGEIFHWTAGRACPKCGLPAAITFDTPQGGDEEDEPLPAPTATKVSDTEAAAQGNGGWSLSTPFQEKKPTPAPPSAPGPFIDAGFTGNSLRGYRVDEPVDPISGRWRCRSCGREWSSSTSRCDDCRGVAS
jgi:ribosomal protein L37E